VSDSGARVLIAVLAALGLALLLLRLRVVPRDVGLTLFALIVAVLGIYAWLGATPALVGGAIIVGVFVLGALIYGALALAQRWAERQP
jgi:hypothetical protein